jgi:flavin reductase (DIM6/NTAB) family NADH-FMN oxidoreductase RutF
MNSPTLPAAVTGGISPNDFRQTLGCFATGIVIVTSLDADGNPVGMTVDSFNSVSMEPPLVLWSLNLNAPSLPAFRAHSSFIVHVLSDQQLDLCKKFAKSGTDKFAGVDWQPGLDGSPLLRDTVATIQCTAYRQYEGGDHEIHLGQVMASSVSDRKPLIYNRGEFGKFGELNP